MGDWEITNQHGDIGSLGFTVTFTVTNRETGEQQDITVNRGSQEEMREAVGERIAEGFDDE